jgi:hypothetical protein
MVGDNRVDAELLGEQQFGTGDIDPHQHPPDPSALDIDGAVGRDLGVAGERSRNAAASRDPPTLACRESTPDGTGDDTRPQLEARRRFAAGDHSTTTTSPRMSGCRLQRYS